MNAASLENEYSSAIEYLYSLRVFGSKLGLTNIQTLCERFDHPEHGLRFIHVAGTNGKGSVCAMLESIYRHGGYRTGLFTSPHLVYFGERIQVNRIPIAKEDVIRLLKIIKSVLDSFPAESHPTFFEVVTLLGLLYFKEQNCDIILWETGLGGRLDATNIVTPIASLITNISLEHQQYLGNTLSAIASEKAGIIKESTPILTSETQEEPLLVIQKTAQEKHSPFFCTSLGNSIPIPPHLATYQKPNMELVLKTVSVLKNILPLSEISIREGLLNTQWAGRFHIIERLGQTLVLDGAHNAACFSALTRSLSERFSEKPAIIMGVLADKNWSEICHLIANFGTEFLTVSVSNHRTLSAQALAEELSKFTPSEVSVIAKNSIEEALNYYQDRPFILICGSLYLIGEVLQKIQSENSEPHPLEKKLNDWGNSSFYCKSCVRGTTL